MNAYKRGAFFWAPIYVVLLLSVRANLCAQEIHIPAAHMLESKEIALSGPWGFYWNRFIDPNASGEAGEPDKIVDFPFSWSEYSRGGLGAGSFHTKVTGLKAKTDYAAYPYDIAATAFSLYANGEHVATVGEPNEDYERSRGDQRMTLIYMTSSADGELDLVMHVSNSFHTYGGVWRAPRIAERAREFYLYNMRQNWQLFLIGAVLVVVLYQFSLFVSRERDFSCLFLSLFSFSVLLRLASHGFSLIALYFPQLPYIIRLKIEYTPLIACPLFFLSHLYYLYPGKIPAAVIRAAAALGTAITAAVYIANPIWTCRLLAVCQLYLGVCALYGVAAMIYIVVRLKNGTGLFILVSLIVMCLGALHDVGVANFILKDEYALPYTFVVFVVIQSAVCARRHEQEWIAVDSLSENLLKTNKAYYRFVPREFLTLLSKKDVVNVGLGEWTARDITLLSADVRNFTTIAENLPAKEVFDLLNRYLMRIGPIITGHGGFIEKYLGDGIIALFPDHGERAFKCALCMQDAAEDLRAALISENKAPVVIGIGIHYGAVVLGTVGDEKRMNEITISRDIETVMALESLTKTFKRPVLVSGAAARAWETPAECGLVLLEEKNETIKDAVYALEKRAGADS